jgi:uncharacterized protein (TIGR00290 family)
VKAAMSDGPRILVSWSGGKDAAWALHIIRRLGLGQVVGLVTSVVPAFGRVAMHGVRMALVRAQAEAVALPLVEVALPWPCPNEHYDGQFGAALAHAREAWDVTHVAFGDLFLADIRAYRERLLGRLGLEPLFPLWEEPTGPLICAMLDAGVRARIVCLDPSLVRRDLAGALLHPELLASLGPAIDPCGERGEFHTFVTDGPMLAHPIPVTRGEVVERDGFVYADLLPRCPE